jgi:hypothetical protein
MRLTTFDSTKNKVVMKILTEPCTWTDSSGKQLQLQDTDMKFGSWNVRSLYRAGFLMSVSEELSKYNSDLVGIQKVRWDRGVTEPACQYTFFYGKGKENQELGTDFFVHKRYFPNFTQHISPI